MKREFLEALGLDRETTDKILSENETDLADAQSKLTAAQTELETLKAAVGDSEALRQELETARRQIADRDYTDAISRAIAGKGLKFSSKAAERDFTARIREKKLELKDGELLGLDDFINTQKESEPDAFASGRPAPHFVAPSGTGGAPPEGIPDNVALARQMGAARAASAKASGDILKNFS